MEYSSSNEEEIIIYNEHGEQEEKMDLGVGRFYECVYCKRGFNTAQALGGHMNIHRKDRSSSSSSRNKPITSSNKQQQQQQVFTKLADHQNIMNIPPPARSYDHHLISTRSSSLVPDHYQVYGKNQHQEPPLVLDDPPMLSRRHHLRFEFSNTKDHLDHMHMMNRHHDHKEAELDLELRLGYD